MTTKRDTATFEEKFAVGKFLATIFPPIQEGVTIAYPDGMSDATVAKEFGVSPATVTYIRQRMHGKLKVRQPAEEPKPDELQMRVAALEGQLVSAHRRISKLAERVAILEGRSSTVITPEPDGSFLINPVAR
jgi:hypothetical protein